MTTHYITGTLFSVSITTPEKVVIQTPIPEKRMLVIWAQISFNRICALSPCLDAQINFAQNSSSRYRFKILLRSLRGGSPHLSQGAGGRSPPIRGSGGRSPPRKMEVWGTEPPRNDMCHISLYHRYLAQCHFVHRLSSWGRKRRRQRSDPSATSMHQEYLRIAYQLAFRF